MGNKQQQTQSDKVIEAKKVVRVAKNRVGKTTIQKLQEDWKGVAGANVKGITLEQFKKLMNQMSHEDLVSLFTLYDIDHNGYISWQEYVCTVTLVMDGTIDEKLDLIFNAFDENRDGTISREEFEKAVKLFYQPNDRGTPLTDAFIKAAFDACDADNSNTITKTEFRQFLDRDQQTFADVCGILAIGLDIN